MRPILGALIIAAVLAGCSSSQTTIQSLGDCNMDGFEDDHEEDWRGEYFLCQNVRGMGIYEETIDCSFGGLAGVELEQGPSNGTVDITIRVEENNELVWNKTISEGDEAWYFVDGNETVRMFVTTSTDFEGTIAFGWGCYQ